MPVNGGMVACGRKNEDMGTDGSQGGEEGLMEQLRFPECMKCGTGVLIPLSDYGREGAPITYKAWVCTNPNCGFNVRIDNGEISLGRMIGSSTK